VRSTAIQVGPEPEILIVDDEAAIREALERALRLEGFGVQTAVDGVAALEEIAQHPPSVVLLDVAMPRLDGVGVIESLRAAGNDVPICVLSARTEVEDRVRGLQAGADDYLVKPFALEELVARLHALLRRRPETPAAVSVGDLHVDPLKRLARRGARELELTRREFELLEAFARHPGQVLSRAQLLQIVWGYDFEVDTNVVDVFVGYLRRKLEAGGESRLIQTVRGVGFALRP
jgi:DNA-binding response OmpR family regulator